MKINDVTLKQGLCQDANFLTGLAITDSSTYTVADKIRNANTWYRKVNAWIWDSTGDWEYDDSNWTNLPVATTDLVTTAGSEQQDYEMPSTAQKIDRVEVLDSEGNYQLLKPFDKSQVLDQSMSEFYETAGFPIYYDLVGRSILLYPKPADASVTATDGLKLYFARDIDEFAITDTATEPGFSKNYHRLISLGMSYDYCLRNGLDDRKTNIRKEIDELKDQLQTEYGARHRNFRTRIIPRIQSEL